MKSKVNDDLASSDDDGDEGPPGLGGSGCATVNMSTANLPEDETPATPKKVSNENGDVIITIPHRPSDWFFPGFMFVLLFGPFPSNIEAKRTMDFFLNRDPAVLSSSEKKA